MPKGVYERTHVVSQKVYPPDLVERVTALYTAGHTQDEVAAELGLTRKVIYRLMKNHGIQARVAAKRDQAGARNHMWRGDSANYQALHLRVEAARGKPDNCGRCGRTDSDTRYEWANLTGNYIDVEDYERMCVSCHRYFDADRRRATGQRTSPYRRSV